MKKEGAITISNLRVSRKDDVWRFEADAVNGPLPTIYYECEADNSFVPPADYSASFVLPAVIAGMSLGLPVYFEFPISPRLAWSLREAVQPFLAQFSAGTKLSVIQFSSLSSSILAAPTRAQGSATGMSCGLDSMATVKSMLDNPVSNFELLKVVALFDVGGSNAAKNVMGKNLHSSRTRRALSCAQLLGLRFVNIRSNIDAWFPGSFAQLHTFRNVSAAYLLSGMVGVYHYANGVVLGNTACRHFDSAYGDAIFLQFLSTEGIEMRQGTPNFTSIDKARLISDFTAAHRYLNVCYFNESNCGECEKCMRRMLIFDSLGILERFSGVFPLEKWTSNRTWYFGYILSMKQDSPPHRELVSHLWETRWLNRRWLIPRLAWKFRRIKNLIARMMGCPRRPL